MLPLVLGANIALALAYAFMNGYSDSGAIVAPAVASRATGRERVLLAAAIAEFLGPFLFGTAVAAAIATSVVNTAVFSQVDLLMALLSTVGWRFFANWLRLPTSASHALMGGLIGAGLAANGPSALNLPGILRILLFLLATPFLGLALGWLAYNGIFLLVRHATPRINRNFQVAELAATMLLALNHGANDGQKSIGLLTLALLIGGIIPRFQVLPLVTILCAVTLSAGVAISSQRILWRVGGSLYRIRPIHGLAATSASFVTMLTSNVLGAPVSGVQILSATIAGAGAAQRPSMVRWTVFQSMAAAWLVTAPCTLICSAGLSWLAQRLTSLH